LGPEGNDAKGGTKTSTGCALSIAKVCTCNQIELGMEFWLLLSSKLSCEIEIIIEPISPGFEDYIK
jgi:hypothetical protein